MEEVKLLLLTAAVVLLGNGGAGAADNAALPEPVKSVYSDYLKIQAQPANDSLTGVAENATAIERAVRGEAKAFPAAVAGEAQSLAKARI